MYYRKIFVVKIDSCGQGTYSLYTYTLVCVCTLYMYVWRKLKMYATLYESCTARSMCT